MSVRHTVRESVLTRETTWTVEGDRLRASTDRDTQDWPLSQVREVRLLFDPTRAAGNRRLCELTLPGRRRLRILNLSYRGLGDFADHTPTFTALVEALLAGLARHNPGCVCRIGKRPVVLALELGFLALAMLFLAMVLVLVDPTMLALLLAAAGLAATALPAVLRYVRANWPRRFDPARPPAGLPGFPGGGQAPD